eukprot:10229835-Ditylum_brightwellii.AAC.1
MVTLDGLWRMYYTEHYWVVQLIQQHQNQYEGNYLHAHHLVNREEHEQLYRADKREYDYHNMVEEALKNQVQEA